MLERIATACVVIAVIAGCSAEQLRGNQQGWRNAECDKIVDPHARERCLKEAETSR